MDQFSDDESLFVLFAAMALIVAGFRYYAPLLRLAPLRSSFARRLLLAATPWIALGPTVLVLNRWADPQVVGHLNYILLFTIGGGAAIFITAHLLPWLGFSLFDDAIERNNPAVLIASVGLIIGVGIIYALANVGLGPTIWTTLIPALVVILLLGFSFLLAESVSRVAEAVAVGRDVATGLRVAAMAVSVSLVLGRAVAGDWSSWGGTWVDLAAHGWPAPLLALLAGFMQRTLKPAPRRPHPSILAFGIIPGVLLLLVALAAILWA